MTNEKAHEYLEYKQRIMTHQRCMHTAEEIEANGMAILALEKQIPKKPIPLDEDAYVCPNCKFICGHEYCRTCGQRLDWG